MTATKLSRRLICPLDSDAQVILAKIGAARKRPRVVFLDEFDVTVDGSSVVRYLLDPITRKEHAKTVFIFWQLSEESKHS